jgi:hypothetical protein
MNFLITKRRSNFEDISILKEHLNGNDMFELLGDKMDVLIPIFIQNIFVIL